MNNFVHLHNHTDYSLLDGAARSETYAKKAKELGMTALGITDHGNMFGVLDHYMACKKEGITPVIGQEFYMAKDSRIIKDPEHRSYHHLVLFAMNNTGYHNLMKLSSIGWTEGKYYKPRIDHQCLEQYNEGLICLSACLAGEIPQYLLCGETEKAYETAKWYKNLFGDRFYIEIQNHDITDELLVLPKLVKLARDLDIKIVATNDVHYCNKEDALSHEVLLCIGTKGKLSDPNHFKFETNEFYLKSQDEMAQLFSEYPDALENTMEIATRCTFDIDFPKGQLPDFPLPKGYDNAALYLEALVEIGIRKRYPRYGIDKQITEALDERLRSEFSTIFRMGFEGYFLIVQDYVMWAKNHGIQVGPGRGSGAGSLVAYCIGITNVDPIKYDLLFERFLNPDRVSLPDFDVDFSKDDRAKVIEYVIGKYGASRTGKIATFSLLKPRQVVSDVARVLGIDSNTAHQITSLIPQRVEDDDEGESQMVDVTLSLALESIEELAEYRNKDPKFALMFDIALKLENLARQVGIHPCGIVIGKTELSEYVPLFVDSKTETVACQYSKTFIEDCGLVKMDLLGLKTLTMIDNAQNLIRETQPDFDISKISFEDEETYKMMAKGDSMMVFQFESEGMQQNLKSLNPTKFSDLYDMNSLYRPGPMEFIPSYIAGKNDESSIKYPDPDLVELLKPTHGVIVYQEQVMKVSQIIAGFTLAQADELRKIMGKKQIKKLPAMKEKFIQGAVDLGRTEEHAKEIFDMLAPFAQYGFNKSHSVCYSDLAYRTAYLKCHYPAQFYAANLTNELEDSKKFRKYVSYIRSTDIEIVPPDINKSSLYFGVDGKRILFGLSGIKGIGEKTAKAIIDERQQNGGYRSISDFLKRTREKGVSSLVFTRLIYGGAFDSLGYNRRTLYLNLEEMIRQQKLQNFDSKESYITFYEDFSLTEKLEKEKDTLGFYVSGHPLDLYKDKWKRHMKLDLSKPDRIHKNHPYNIIGMVKSVRRITAKNGSNMAFVTIEDYNGELSITVFSQLWKSYSQVIEEGRIMAFCGTFSEYSGSLGFVASSVFPDLSQLRSIPSSRVIVEIVRGASSKDIMKAIAENPGETELYFSVYEQREDYDNMLEGHKKPHIIRPREGYKVKVCPKLAQDLLQGKGVLGVYLE